MEIGRLSGYAQKTSEARPQRTDPAVWGGGDLLSRGPPQYHRRGGA